MTTRKANPRQSAIAFVAAGIQRIGNGSISQINDALEANGVRYGHAVLRTYLQRMHRLGLVRKWNNQTPSVGEGEEFRWHELTPRGKAFLDNWQLALSTQPKPRQRERS